jgi:hypothetical protein
MTRSLGVSGGNGAKVEDPTVMPLGQAIGTSSANAADENKNTTTANVASFVSVMDISFSVESKKLVVSHRSRQSGCHHKGCPEKTRPTLNGRMTDYQPICQFARESKQI